ncbi:MAG: TPM domain-containing protein [Cyanobacteriota bacterium]|nr:TPM domain-containing protein [Cyanobacteriota bacterium]
MKQLLASRINGRFNWRQLYRNSWQVVVAIALALFVAATPARATGIYDLPFISAGDSTAVVDDGDVLSRVNQGRIRSALEEIRDRTGTEVRFVTIRHLDFGETIDSFTSDLFEAWFPTPEDGANQVLLALDVVTNSSAIRVGDGVEPALTEEIAESIAQETIIIPLRKGDKYNQAFLDASDRLVAVLSGEPDPGPPAVEDTIQVEGTFATAEETEATKSNSTTLVIVLLLGATVIPMVTYFALYR